jgi:hypothetical protein
MKKIALVLAVLLVVGGAAFAEVMVGGEATVAGSVSTTIGMDLDSRVWGADADSSITLTIPLANGSDGASGDDDMYGEISLTGVAVNLSGTGFDDDDNDGGTLAAKIVAGDVYVGLNWGGYNNNYAAGTGDFDVNLDADWYAVPAYGDIALGFNNGMIGFELEVAAKSGITRAADATAEVLYGMWTGYTEDDDATATTQDATGLVFSVDIEYVSEMITFPVYLTIDPEYMADTLLFAASVDPSVMVGPLTITAPVDFLMVGEDMGFDAAPTLAFAVMDGVTLGADAYFYNHFDTNYLANAGVNVATDGLVSGLTASVDLGLTDLSSDNDGLGWGVDVAVGYVLADGLTLNVAPGYDSTQDVDIAGSLVFGSAFTGIDNTTITLDYAKGCYDVDGTTASSDAGILSLVTKVAF